MELVRKQTYITPAQDRAVKRLAQQQGTTEAEILRKALDLLLAREGIGENEDPFADLIGLFAGLPRSIMTTSIADIKRVFIDTSAWIDLMINNSPMWTPSPLHGSSPIQISMRSLLSIII